MESKAGFFGPWLNWPFSIDGWKMNFPFGMSYFEGGLKLFIFRGCKPFQNPDAQWDWYIYLHLPPKLPSFVFL